MGYYYLPSFTQYFSSLIHSVPSDPKFIAAHLIPDNDDRDNNKVYFFFTEKASEVGDREGAIHTRVGRVCAVSFDTAMEPLLLRFRINRESSTDT